MQVLRIPFFILFSLGVHLLALQVDMPQLSASQPAQQHVVGYVARPISSFLSPPTSKTEVDELPTLKIPKPNLVRQHPPVTTKAKPLELKLNKEEATSSIVPAAEKTAEPTPAQPVSTDVESSEPVVVRSEAPASTEQQVAVFTAGQQVTPVTVSQLEPSSARVATNAAAGQVVAERSKLIYQALPLYELNPKPKYPAVARRRGQQGTVNLEVLVLANGRVGEIRLLTSSGYKILDRAALKSVRRWQFKPATSVGLPVASRVQIPVAFVLANK